MANFKHYFNSNFSGCLLVATGFDPHRVRDVRMYLMPGIVDVVGVNDGVDKWVAPLESPFLETLLKALKSHWAGDTVAFPVTLGQRQTRRKLVEDESAVVVPPRTRKALVEDSAAPQAPIRRRALLQD